MSNNNSQNVEEKDKNAPTPEYSPKNRDLIAKMGEDSELAALYLTFLQKAGTYRYSYNFTWLGRPIIQFPQDILAAQELIWSVKPTLIIETGIAHGGSLIHSASILELINYSQSIVLGIDVEIRPHNRVEIERHRLSKRIKMLEGSSIDPVIVSQVKDIAKGHSSIMVFLDSNHTHEHVLKELEAYSSLVTPGSYLVVYDTAIEDLPLGFISNRPWDVGNNPKTAVHEFLKSTSRFVIDHGIQDKLVFTVAPDGYLKCIR